MEKIRASIIILNGEVINAESYLPYANRDQVYEVIRMVDGKFIFLNDHLDRLHSSFSKTGREFSEIDSVKASLQKLADISKINNGNIKLAVIEDNDVFQIACFFVPHHYPTDKQYREGVNTKVFEFERPNPTVKRWNSTFRTSVNQFIKEENIFEALLLNENKELTEGSRSNLFFIDQYDQLYTAPEPIVLPGITRKYVLDICEHKNIPLIQKTLTLKQAEKMKSCFITGTSPKVLQVRTINQITYELAGVQMKRIIDAYDDMIIAQLQS